MSDYKPYPAYKDSGVEWLGKVPDGWKVKPLWTVTTVNNDERDRNIKDLDEIEYVDISSVTLEYGVSNPTRMLAKDAPSRAQRKAKSGDVVISTVRTYLRAIGKVLPEHEAAIFSTGFAIVRSSKEITPSFLYYALLSEYFLSEVEARSNGISYPAINASDLLKINIAVPLLEEQIKLTQLLDRETVRIDALVSKKTRFIELLREKRQALITQAVTRGLDPNVNMKDSGVEWLGEVPEHWDIGVLCHIASRTVVGIAEAATHAYANSGVPILRSTNIRPYKIIGEIFHINPKFALDKGTKLINAGDLITVRTGNAGVTAVIPAELDGCQCFTMLITTLQSAYIPNFYCYWMNSVTAMHYFALEGWGTAQINISVPILKALPVPMLSNQEQKEIVAYLDLETTRIDSLITKTQHSINLLKERRAALITAAVTGQIDVRNTA